MTRWYLSLSSDETTPDTAPWVGIPDGTTGIAAFSDTLTSQTLSFMLTPDLKLLMAYTNYDHENPDVEWHQCGHFNSDGTLEMYEPTPCS